MGRENKLLERLEETQNKFSVFIIATEGAKTEVNYFNKLHLNKLLKTHIKIKTLPSSDGKSAPLKVLDRLNTFVEENEINISYDEFWIVIDRDSSSWTLEDIKTVSEQCKLNSYGFAISVPAFELWLLLHLVDIGKFSDIENNALLENKKVTKRKNSRHRLETEIIKYCGEYNKSYPSMKIFIPTTLTAIKNAKKLIKDENDEIPDYLATFVYKLVEKIIDPTKIAEFTQT